MNYKKNKLNIFHFLFFIIILYAISFLIAYRIIQSTEKNMENSFRKSKEINTLLNELTNIEISSSNLNTPGNDVFVNRRIDWEKKNYQFFHNTFHNKLRLFRSNLALSSINEKRAILEKIDALEKHEYSLKNITFSIFDHLKKNNLSTAYESMSQLDRNNSRFREYFVILRSDLHKISIAFDKQQYALMQLQNNKTTLILIFNIFSSIFLFCFTFWLSRKSRASEKILQFYKYAIDQTTILAITDKHGSITYANNKFSAISEYSSDELLGKDHRIVNSKTHSKEFFKEMWATISKGKIWNNEICNKSKTGKIYWVDTTIIPFVNNKNQPEWYIAIRTDITKNKQALDFSHKEKELTQKIQAKLEEAEKIAKFGSWEFDFKTRNFICSKGFFSLLKRDARDFLPCELFLTYIDKNDREIFAQALEASIMSHQGFSCTYRIILSDSSTIWCHTDGHFIDIAEQQSPVLIGTIQDVTIKVESEQSLTEYARQSADAKETKSKFLANMSHEIRTPMNGIIGMVNLLLSSIEDPSHIEKLKIIQNSGNALLDLINDVLDFSKLEVNKIELENIAFSPHRIIQEIVELLQSRALEKRTSLSYIINPNTPSWIKGDSTRFRQVVTNLISNALKFTENGKVEITSNVKQKKENLWQIQFSVKDTGIGIPQEMQNKLFQSFSQVDASTTRKFGGTGLGLAICKGLCEKMGGDIWVESEMGKGSTFSFTIEARECAAEHKEIASHNPFTKFDSDMGKKHPLHILIAEDNRTNQLVATGLLGKLGYKADVVGNGLEALASLEEKFYDLIFMDCHMPELDGFETSKRIISKYGANRPRIIALTASTMKEDIDNCYASGMDGFLSKPISIASLVDFLYSSKQISPSNKGAA